MNTFLDFLMYAGTLVAVSGVGLVCLVGLIVWLAGGELRHPPRKTK